jgi:chemotaxis protein CheX
VRPETMLEEHEIRTFVFGTTQYFEVAAQQPATLGSPYLVPQGVPEIHEYTGVISITGRREGIVYFTAPRGMLTVMLMKMNESNVSHENMCDLVGEVANTISGNARRDFGNDFTISVPTVVAGNGEEIQAPSGCRPMVIPINWRSHSAKLVVCLK